MQYNFKVDIDKVYHLFLEDDVELDVNYIKELKLLYDEFRIRYNTEYDISDKMSLINSLEGNSDEQQILLIGVKDDIETILCYYFIGDDMEDEWYQVGMEDFKEMLKRKID